MPSLVSCLYYNPDGDFETLLFKNDATKASYPNPFFRKHSTSEVEIEICKRLMMAPPHSNVIQILGVDETNHWIDMEFLDTGLPGRVPSSDIQAALAHLHSIGCVYIDLKQDNIGFSRITQTYKLFDFNMSGIVHPTDASQWLYTPEIGYIYKHILTLQPSYSGVSLYHYDTLCFNLWMDERSKKGYKD
jgi:hypothetical protein